MKEMRQKKKCNERSGDADKAADNERGTEQGAAFCRPLAQMVGKGAWHAQRYHARDKLRPYEDCRQFPPSSGLQKSGGYNACACVQKHDPQLGAKRLDDRSKSGLLT